MTRKIKGSGGGGCFPSYVKVYTPNGEVPISEIKVGDEILSFNFEGTIEVSKVTKVFQHEAMDVWRSNYWGGSLPSTLNHWVLNQFNSFAEIGNLTELDALVDQIGNLRPITSKQYIGLEPVYNLHVEPNHTFIADGIRVHNGGLGLTTPIIGSGGGGGKGDGGRAPVESSDSLQSKQYAKVLDLVSEGEVEGLVSGNQSIYFDGTPLQNPDGSYNFNGFVTQSRTGTQDQTYMLGFGAVESENYVGVQLTNALPVVRQISNPNADSVRVTLSIPTLSSTDTSTGDVGGSSVEISIEVQPSGGSFTPVRLRQEYSTTGMVQLSPTVVSMANLSPSVIIGVSWIGVIPPENSTVVEATSNNGVFAWLTDDTSTPTIDVTTVQSVSYSIQRRIAGSADAWVTIYSDGFSGIGTYEILSSPLRSQYTPPQGTYFYTDSDLTNTYEYQVITTASSTGTTATLENSSILTWYDTDIISGKSSSKYQRAYMVPLEGNSPWNVRITRITEDSTTQYSQNKSFWESYTEIISTKLSYPNSALVGVSIDSSQFSSIPSRAYDMRGIKVRVPSNYNAITRTYTGIWDGTFSIAWTDNPAWCFYDLVTSERYGLGGFITDAQVDTATLYTLGQYCDELVPNGYGGTEPRYTCNMYLQTREEAYKVITDMASIFSGLVFWAGGNLTTTYDAPSDYAYQFTSANVIDGEFTYQGSSKNSRHTVALVAWNDPSDNFTRKVEYVEDTEGIQLWGVRETETIAIGCTSRGQAHRMGKRILLTERYLTEIVSFKTGIEGIYGCYPGALIKVMDNNRSGVRFGGRVSAATISSITVDYPVVIEAGKTYTLSIINPDGTIEERALTNSPGSTSVLSVALSFSSIPNTQSVWVLGSSTLDVQLFKVLTIAEKDDLQWEVTALQYNPSKFAAIEQGLQFDPLNTSALSSISAILAPTSLSVTEELYKSSVNTVDNRMVISWAAPTNSFLSHYKVSWRYLNGNWNVLPDTKGTEVSVEPILPGTVEVKVSAVNMVGVTSSPATATKVLLGKTSPPADVTGFAIQVLGSTSYLTWVGVPDLDISGYTIRYSPMLYGVTWQTSTSLVPMVSHPATSVAIPSLNGTILIKAVDTSGNESVNATTISTNVSQLDSFNAVANIVEQSAFLGTKTDVAIVGGALQLSGSFMETWIPLNAVKSLRLGMGTSSSGMYEFSDTVDLGGVFTSRVTSKLHAFGNNTKGTMDSWVPLAFANPLGGTDSSTWDVLLEIRTTDDDPLGTPTWGDWKPLIVGDHSARAMQFRINLYAYSGYVTPVVDVLEVSIDMPDRVYGGNDVVCSTSGLTVTYSPAFKVSPALALAIQGLDTGDYPVITGKSASGFNIIFRNSAGTAVERTFDYVAKGYGYII